MKVSSFRFSKIFLAAMFGIALAGCQSKDIGASIIDDEKTPPDLVISEATISPDYADKNSVVVYLIVENKGGSDVEKQFSVFGNWVENPSGVSKISLSINMPVAAGGKQSIQKSVPLSSLIGNTGTYLFKVDACGDLSCDNQIEESNEDNNVITTQFSL